MKITVDRDTCEGHGQCAAVAPDLFRLNDDGDLELTYNDTQNIPAERVDDARHAMSCCPVLALVELGP